MNNNGEFEQVQGFENFGHQGPEDDYPHITRDEDTPMNPAQPVQAGPSTSRPATNNRPAVINPQPEVVIIPAEPSGKEIGINKPTPFNGERKKVETFIQECRMYLQINKKIYTTDAAKVAFFLSFMNDKEALRWKQTFLRSITNEDGEMNFPSIKAFVTNLKEYFQPANQTSDAAHELATLKQGKKSAEEVVTEFRLLTSLAGYSAETPSDHLHLIEKFQNVLNPPLVKKIMLLDNPPTTIHEWVKKAILLDSQYRMTMDVLNRKTGGGKRDERKTGKPGWANYFDNRKPRKERDPDAMDIDGMSTEKRTILMKKGACFICEEPGHMAREHDEYMRRKKGKGSFRPTPPPPKKHTIQEIHALLQALSVEETKQLVALNSSGHEQEEKIEDEDF